MPRAEIKHTYENTTTVLRMNPTDNNNSYNCSYVKPVYPSQGTDENERIGRKISVKSLHWSGVFNTNASAFNTFYAAQTYHLNRPWFAKFRAMVVEFDPDFAITTGNIMSWFNATYVYFDEGKQPSVHTSMLRESTAYTGSFKIIIDKKFTLTSSKPSYPFDFNIPWRPTLNFDSAGQTDPTNRKLICFVIGPNEFEADMSFNLGTWFSTTYGLNPNGATIGLHLSNLKLSFYDN